MALDHHKTGRRLGHLDEAIRRSCRARSG
jgi:hypothetical protein